MGQTLSGTNIKWEKHQEGQRTCQRMGVGQKLSETNIELDKHIVGQTSSNTHNKLDKHQVKHTTSGTSIKWDKNQVGQTSSGTNIKWDKHQVGQKSSEANIYSMWNGISDFADLLVFKFSCFLTYFLFKTLGFRPREDHQLCDNVKFHLQSQI